MGFCPILSSGHTRLSFTGFVGNNQNGLAASEVARKIDVFSDLWPSYLLEPQLAQQAAEPVRQDSTRFTIS